MNWMSIVTFIMKNVDLSELIIEKLFPEYIVVNHFLGSWEQEVYLGAC